MTHSQELEEFFADMHVLKRIIHKHAETTCSSLPTKSQIGILLALHKEEAMGIKELAEQFCMTSSAVTQLVDALYEQELVEREVSPTDRRRMCITLTAKGETVLKDSHKMRIDKLRELFSPLDTEEIRQLRTIQKKIIEHFTQS